MKQTLSFTVEWAQYTPQKTMNEFADKIRHLVLDEMKLRTEPPFDHFRSLVEISDCRSWQE